MYSRNVGGTAGNVVANRLSDDPNSKVLVIEAGIKSVIAKCMKLEVDELPSNEGQEDIIVPFFGVQASPDTIFTWNYTTTPQVGLNNRIVNYPRGRVLGVSSSISKPLYSRKLCSASKQRFLDFMVYTRCSKDDFNRYASFTGDEGWSWNSMQEFILKARLHEAYYELY